MVIYLVCFDLSATPEELREQLFYWLQFLNSSTPSDNVINSVDENNDNNNNNNNTITTTTTTTTALVGQEPLEDVEPVAALSNIHEFVSHLPEGKKSKRVALVIILSELVGYITRAGDKGSQLSGGQKQHTENVWKL